MGCSNVQSYLLLCFFWWYDTTTTARRCDDSQQRNHHVATADVHFIHVYDYVWHILMSFKDKWNIYACVCVCVCVRSNVPLLYAVVICISSQYIIAQCWEYARIRVEYEDILNRNLIDMHMHTVKLNIYYEHIICEPVFDSHNLDC